MESRGPSEVWAKELTRLITRLPAIVARELAGVGASFGSRICGCTNSGGQSGAENGILTVMCGGDCKL